MNWLDSNSRPGKSAAWPFWIVAGAVVVLASVLAAWTLFRGWPNPIPTASDGRSELASFQSPFTNTAPGIAYVGDAVCAECHPSHAQTYRRHPMGRSLSPVALAAASQRNDRAVRNPFTALQLQFLVEPMGKDVWHSEIIRDTTGKMLAQTRVPVHYAIGSGVRARSYLVNRDGFVFQSPITWYSQKGIWDLSPGFQEYPDRFERQMQPACLYCHSNRVEHVPGTANRYREPVFRGHAIGCERCHGPGELHKALRESGEVVENVDHSIVNPRHLPTDLREAVCHQCHLEGELRVLRRGRRFDEFRPGLPFELFWSVYANRQTAAQEQVVVGHVEQMHASRCYQKSGGDLGCISCHDPHVYPEGPAKESFYRQRCLTCHAESACRIALDERKKATAADACAQCHMPAVNTIDANHVAMTDHRVLRKPIPLAPRRPPSTRLMFGESPLRRFPWAAGKASDPDADRDQALAHVELAKKGHPAAQDLCEIALPALDAALAQVPDDKPILEARAFALLMQKRPEEALAACEVLLAEAPEQEFTLVLAGHVAESLRRPQAAADYWQRAQRVNPWMARYHVQRGRILSILNDWEGARAECQKALELNAASIESRIVMAGYWLERGDRPRARAEFEILRALKPPNLAELEAWFAQHDR